MRPILLLVLVALAAAQPARAQPSVLLVRHAEKADESPDPPLSPAGRARARALGEHLRDAGVSAIYVSELRRSAETAAPLAERLRLRPQVVPRADVKGLCARLRRHGSGAVLVVGHSDTLPAILRELGHRGEVRIEKADYDDLFVLTPRAGAPPVLLRLHL